MKKSLLIAAAALTALAAPAAAERPDGEARLARALEGRVAGKPVDCIDLKRVRTSQIIPNTAILYDTGSTIYVNRPDAGAESLSSWDIQVNRVHTGRLCSIDTVELIDSGSRMMSGIVFLGDFVPYERVRR